MGRSSNAEANTEHPPRPVEPPASDKDEEIDACCPISPKSILEAILFVGHPDNEPIESRTVAKLIRGVDPTEIDALVEDLNHDYARADFPFGIRSRGTGYRLELNEAYDHVRQRFYGRVRRARLSQMAVDVLAIVAYNQPVTRPQVDKLLSHSGTNLGRVLNQLVRRELIALRITEGTPKRREYVTTDRFLDLFDLDDLDDLPRSEEPQ